MGIFSWIFGKGKKEEKKIESILFNELENYLLIKDRENKDGEKILITQIESLINQLIKELREEREAIIKVDLKDKKAEERIKVIVLENLGCYSNHVEKLILNLSKLEKTNLNKLVDAIDKELFEFNNKSKMSYEKSTFLVGKELGDIKESINKFFRELKKLLEENKDLMEKIKSVYLTKTSLCEIKDNEAGKAESEKNLREIDKKLKKVNEDRDKIEKIIEEIKKSEKYIYQQKNKEKAKEKNKELGNTIFKLKSLIDFKLLESIHHASENKMRILKSYQQDFNQMFDKDKPELIEFLGDDEKNTIIEEVARIKITKEEICRIEEEADLLENQNLELEKKRSELDEIKKKKEWEENRIKKIDEIIRDIKVKISEELRKIGVEII